jgi:transposase-like protein
VHRAVDQHGQIIDVFVAKHRDIASARRFFTTVLAAHRSLVEVVTDRAPALANEIEELIPAAFHNTGQYENDRCESDHGRSQVRLRPMRGLKTDRTASVVIRGHALARASDAAITSSVWKRRPCSVQRHHSTNSNSRPE